MFCINEKCNTWWGSKESHISEKSRALREASKGVINATFKSLIIKEALDKELYKGLTNKFFPNLEHVDLFRVNLNDLTVNLNVKSAILRSCQFEIKEPFSIDEFTFPNAESQVLDRMISDITPKSRLPKLVGLKHLEIKHCYMDNKLSNNKFPSLRSMVLEGVSVCAKIMITRMKMLHSLELIDIEKLP